MSIDFADGDVYKIVYRWYEDLQNDRGARARLRRCSNPTDAVYTEAYRSLLEAIERQAKRNAAKQETDEKSFKLSNEQRYRLAAVAIILANVRDHKVAQSTGSILAGYTSGGPALSPLRFRRLLSYTSLDDLFLPMLRAVHLLKNTFDIYKLARDLMCWSDSTRRRWAYDYFDQLSKNNK